MPKGDKLPIKQLLFIKYYLIDKNATQAYIKAGYNGKGAESSASKLLTNPKVKAIIDAELNKTMNELDITAERVLKGFKEVAERSLQRVPVMYYDKEDKEYKQKTENWEWLRTFDAGGANTALSWLGKYHKLFTEKHELTGKDGWPIEVVDFSNMTAKQIQEHLKSLM